MTAPTFTAPPPAPSRSDSATDFITKANAFVAWMEVFEGEMETGVAWFEAEAAAVDADATDVAAAVGMAAAATERAATSTSTLAVGAGTLDITFTEPKPGFAVNDQVVVVLRSDTTIRMFGTVATFNGTDHMTVTVISSGVFGSGTFSGWDILSASFMATGATAAQVLAQTSTDVALTPANVPTILGLAIALAVVL